MIVAIFALLIILTIASTLTMQFKFKQENSILISFLGISLLLYLGKK